MRNRTRHLMLMAVCAGALSASELRGQTQQGADAEARLGQIDFATTAGEEAHQQFIEGMLLLHSFEYDLARLAFRRAQEIEPEFAMAYWGEAMTHNFALWGTQDRDTAKAILARLAPTPEGRLRAAASDKEREWLRAADLLFGEGEKAERDRAYMAHLRRMHARHPEDHEITTLYGLAILGTAEARDFKTYMRAASVLEPVFAENPQHPGAAHYLIHSYDDPVHASLGVRAATAYEQIAPAAPHAQHMISHIFIALGDWERVVEANLIARDIRNEREALLGRPPGYCAHSTQWLQYGWLQQGRIGDAEDLLRQCLNHFVETPTKGNANYLAHMRTAFLIDGQRYERLARWEADLSGFEVAEIEGAYGLAYAALKAGDPEPARRFLDLSKASDDQVVEVQRLEIEGLLALQAGRRDDALQALRHAAEIESSRPYFSGPPSVAKPPQELLGEELLRHGEFQEARIAFENALDRTPGRPLALLGLLEALTELGERDAAAEVEWQLQEIWRDAEPSVEAARRIRLAGQSRD